MQPNGTKDLLSSVPNLSRHRILLENTFHQIKQLFPNLHPSTDNQFRITDWTFDVNDLGLTHFDETSLFQSPVFNEKSRFFASIA